MIVIKIAIFIVAVCIILGAAFAIAALIFVIWARWKDKHNY